MRDGIKRAAGPALMRRLKPDAETVGDSATGTRLGRSLPSDIIERMNPFYAHSDCWSDGHTPSR